MKSYFFRGADGTFLQADAVDEFAARQRAMVERWGSHPDAVVPHAPHYQGTGLTRCDAAGMPLLVATAKVK